MRWDWLSAAGDCPPGNRATSMKWHLSWVEWCPPQRCIQTLTPYLCQPASEYSVVSDSLWPHGRELTRTTSSVPWNSPGRNTGAGYCFLFQGILPTQGSNACLLQNSHLLHWQAGSSPLSHLGRPPVNVTFFKIRVFANMAKLRRNHEGSLSPIWWVAL